MAWLYISEYSELPNQNGHMILIGKEPAIAAQRVAIGGASTQSAAIQHETKFIRINVDEACSYKVGTNPTAVVTEGRLSAGATEFFGVSEKSFKIAVIANT